MPSICQVLGCAQPCQSCVCSIVILLVKSGISWIPDIELHSMWAQPPACIALLVTRSRL